MSPATGSHVNCGYQKYVPHDWKGTPFRVRVLDAAWEVSGTCPRCKGDFCAEISFVWRAPLVAGAEDGAETGASTVRVMVDCSCGGGHAERPPSAPGCGAYGAVEWQETAAPGTDSIKDTELLAYGVD